MTGSARGTLFDRTVAQIVPLVPGPVVRVLAAPYVAGLTLEDGIAKVKELNRAGLQATIDILGESVDDDSHNDDVVRDYIALLDAIAADSLMANISLKPSAFGSKTDWRARERVITAILEHAQALAIFVRIDMEDATTTEETLAMYRRLRERGVSCTGIVLQSRLWRTLRDVAELADLVPNVRLCKGVYLEPAHIAMQDYDAIRAGFRTALRRLLESGCYVGVATHDELLIVEALGVIQELRLPRDAYEFQMLLGVREDLARLLVRDHTVRIYVPFGADATAYSQRRMRENPAMAGLVAHAVIRRFLPKGRSKTRHASATGWGTDDKGEP